MIVNQIYAIFEDKQYDATSQATREKVAELMQQVCIPSPLPERVVHLPLRANPIVSFQMQECGAPPKPLMGELGPGELSSQPFRAKYANFFPLTHSYGDGS